MNLDDCKAFQYKKESSNTELEWINKNVTWKFSDKVNFSADRISILTFCEHLKFCISMSPSATHHVLQIEVPQYSPWIGISQCHVTRASWKTGLPSPKNPKQYFPQVFSKLSWDATARGRGGEQHTRYWVVQLTGHLPRVCQTQVYIHILPNLEQRWEIWSPATQMDVLSWHYTRKTAGDLLTSFSKSSASRHWGTSQSFIKTKTFSHRQLNIINRSIPPLSTSKKKNVADLALDSSKTEKVLLP